MAPKEWEKVYNLQDELEDLNPIPPEPVQLPDFNPPAPPTEPPAHTPAWRRLVDVLPPRLPGFAVLVLVLLVVVFICYRGGLIECDAEARLPAMTSLRDTALVGTGLVTLLTMVMISCLII